MTNKKRIIAISGSTRKESTNLSYIHAITELASTAFEILIFNGLSDIPHFNPDLDNENPPKQVVDFRKQLRETDGILICTPEYAMGVPGTLKNAIDWIVSSCEFSKKPVALITASSMGQKGHASLLETLKIIESDIDDTTQLLIPYAKTKIGNDSKIKDAETLTKVKKVIEALAKKL